MRSLSLFFKEVRLVQGVQNFLSCRLGELPVVLKRWVVTCDGRENLYAEAAGAGQPVP